MTSYIILRSIAYITAAIICISNKYYGVGVLFVLLTLAALNRLFEFDISEGLKIGFVCVTIYIMWRVSDDKKP